MKVHIISPNSQYITMFVNVGHNLVFRIEEADLVCFTGGEDVTPELYGEKVHPYTGNSPARDRAEKQLFEKALSLSIPMVGICRGGQFLNVMNGGRMFQHVTNHGGNHILRDVDTGQAIKVSSTHHQMMRAGELGTVIGIANEWGNKEYMPKILDEEHAPIPYLHHEPDTEVVYYPNTKCLCFQPHPEFPGYKEMTEYFFSLVNSLLLTK